MTLGSRPSRDLPWYNLRLAPVLGGQGEDQRKRQAAPACWWQLNKSKGNYVRGSWREDEWIPASARHILKVYKEALSRFSHIYCVGVLNTTSLPQGYILRATSGSGKDKWNPRSKDRAGDEKPPIAGLQITDQPAVISF